MSCFQSISKRWSVLDNGKSTIVHEILEDANIHSFPCRPAEFSQKKEPEPQPRNEDEDDDLFVNNNRPTLSDTEDESSDEED